MDLAVGVIIGAAFGKIVTTLVEGILMPPIGLLLGSVDFSSLFAVLDRSKGVQASLAGAKAKGIPVIADGQFLNDIIGFLVVARAVFVIVKQVNRIKSAVDKRGRRRVRHQGRSVLRIDDFDQGVALPELHVGARAGRTAALAAADAVIFSVNRNREGCNVYRSYD